MRVRYESFGGIVRTEVPHFTLFVTKGFLKRLGFPGSPLWEREPAEVLSAPLSVHFDLTRRCDRRCEHCYAESCASPARELSFREACDVIDALARLGVFSIAFGGGEPFLREDLFALAGYARERGIVPTATTNGSALDERSAAECRVFAHIHISATPDGGDWLRAARLLRAAGVEVGINCVVDRVGFERLENLCRTAAEAGIAQIMFLRLKPFGRAAPRYEETRLTREQAQRFARRVARLARRWGVRPLADCSLLPLLCADKPDRRRLEFFGAEGCPGGNAIAQVDPEGRVRACSFARGSAGPAADLERSWLDSDHFRAFRARARLVGEPCARCAYLGVCRGGCPAIAEALTGDFAHPDPECPLAAASARPQARPSALRRAQLP